MDLSEHFASQTPRGIPLQRVDERHFPPSRGDRLEGRLADCKLLGTSFRSIASERDLIASPSLSFTNNRAARPAEYSFLFSRKSLMSP